MKVLAQKDFTPREAVTEALLQHVSVFLHNPVDYVEMYLELPNGAFTEAQAEVVEGLGDEVARRLCAPAVRWLKAQGQSTEGMEAVK